MDRKGEHSRSCYFFGYFPLFIICTIPISLRLFFSILIPWSCDFGYGWFINKVREIILVLACTHILYLYIALLPYRPTNTYTSHLTTENRTSKDLPPLPADFRNFQGDYYPEDDDFYGGDNPLSPIDDEFDMDGRPRVPLIHLAQQFQDPPSESSDPGYPMGRYRLSTISEKSERTEASRNWPSRQQLVAHNDPKPSPPMSSNTSYGEVIGEFAFIACLMRVI